MRQVYKVGQNCPGFGRSLNGLFKQAITAGKRVRAETSISTGSVSVSSAAVELAQLKLPTRNFDDAKVCIIGAGKMSTLLVKHLLSKGCKEVTILNRSLPRLVGGWVVVGWLGVGWGRLVGWRRAPELVAVRLRWRVLGMRLSLCVRACMLMTQFSGMSATNHAFACLSQESCVCCSFSNTHRAQALQEEFPDMKMNIHLMNDLMSCVENSDLIFAASGSEELLVNKEDVENMPPR